MMNPHFRWFLEGRILIICILSDHKPLIYPLHQQKEGKSARQLQHLLFIAEFTGYLCHVSGRDNVVADAFSRPAAAVAPPYSRLCNWIDSCWRRNRPTVVRQKPCCPAPA